MPAPEVSSEIVHATTVAIGGRAVLIQGRSGTGKSDLALRLIDRGATLVSDDQTMLVRRGTTLIASPPPTIAGRMEVRGLGIVEMAHVADAPVSLVVVIDAAPERLPTMPAERRFAGVVIPAVTLTPLEPSTAIKVELALKRFGGAG